MSYNCVASLSVIQELKKCKYFSRDLGSTITVPDKNGDRVFNQKDQFSYIYNVHYKASIQRMGNIGDIVIYVDHQLIKPVILLYKNSEEIVEEYNYQIAKEKGIESYLGSLLKRLEEHCQSLIDKEEASKKVVVEVKKGSADVITMNPGNVKYEDLQVYLKQKAQNRFNSGEGGLNNSK
jgi:hypothetical protein